MNCKFEGLPFILLSLVSLLIFILCVLLGVAFFTLFERKVLSYSQNRLGPNKVGGMGIIQPALDGVKLLLKENVVPFQVFRFGFVLFPSLVFPIIICSWLIPMETLVFNFSMYLALFLLRLVGIGVFGVMISGIISNSKFGYLGGIRASAQSVRYEIVFSLVLFRIMVGYGSLFWSRGEYLLWLLFPFWIFTILSEVNRAPFDFAEGERELISGFNTEYSSSLFVLIFLREYGMVLVFSFLTSSLFCGGSVLIGGLFSFMFLFFRSCYPRFRFDMLIGICWLFLLPIIIISIFQLLILLKE